MEEEANKEVAEVVSQVSASLTREVCMCRCAVRVAQFVFFKGCVVAIDEVKQQVSEEKKMQVQSIS